MIDSHPLTSARPWSRKFHGPFDQGMLARSWSEVQSVCSAQVEDRLRIVFVELAQNIQHHSQDPSAGTLEIESSPTLTWRVVARSHASPGSAQAVVSSLAMLGRLPRPDLRKLYRDRLHQQRAMERKGAGLGLIEICRQSDAPPTCGVFNVASDRALLEVSVLLADRGKTMPPPALNLPPTDVTPEVQYDPVSGVLSLRGESFPENVADFYRPVSDWISNRIAENEAISLHLALDYLNTSSTKALLDILDELESFHVSGGSVAVAWVASSETMLEAGEDLFYGLTLPARILEPGEDV